MQPLIPYSESFRLPPSGPATFYKTRNGSRQTYPIDEWILSNYSVAVRRVDKVIAGTPSGVHNSWTAAGEVPLTTSEIPPGGADETTAGRRQFRGHAADAMNGALRKLQSKAHDEQASLGAAIGESRESFKMIAARATQLARAARLLSKGRFLDVATTLGLVEKRKPPTKRVRRSRVLRWAKHPTQKLWYPRPVKDWRTRVRGFAGLWLEYSFGWAPIVNDINAAIKVIDRSPFMDVPLRASSSVSGRFVVSQWTSSYDHTTRQSYTIKAVCGGHYRVSNPNYDLVSRLGLVNLASVALELTTLSFVWASWLTNFDEYVANLADGYKSQMINVWYGYKVTSVNERKTWSRSPPRWDLWIQSSATSYGRTVGSLPGVTLRVRQRFIPSFLRAANASALLVQLFRKSG